MQPHSLKAYEKYIWGELDVEDVIRMTMERSLAVLGATNAVCFLPTSSGDFITGAWVNCDQPKDEVEVLLDDLANFVPQQFVGESTARVLGKTERAEVIQHARYLADCQMLVCPCKVKTQENPDNMAMLLFFRSEAQPFKEQSVKELDAMMAIFGKQLDRIVRIHNRHIPDDKWKGIGNLSEEDEEGDEPIGAA